MYADPVGVAREFDAGRRQAAVDGVVAGVADPPGPDELRDMVDQVLRGITVGDFADVLLRAAAFARVVATGRALLADTDALAAARIQSVAEQLGRAARLELAGQLSLDPGRAVRNAWRRSPVTLVECAGPRQPRVPHSAATSGHAP